VIASNISTRSGLQLSRLIVNILSEGCLLWKYKDVYCGTSIYWV